MRNKLFFILLVGSMSLSFTANGQTTEQIAREVDSLATNEQPLTGSTRRQALMNELEFIIDNIEHVYVSARRGMGDEEWERRVSNLRNDANLLLDNGRVVWWVWRDFSLLIDDSHFEFPDDGSFNRHRLFVEEERILPLWVQIWRDGSLYNVYDYSGVIPRYSEIITISAMRDGRHTQTFQADELGRRCLEMTNGEPAYAFANGNTSNQPDITRDWMSLANSIASPSWQEWEVTYKEPDNEGVDTVVLQGMTRKELYELYRNTGNKRRAKDETGFSRKPIVYTDLGEGTGVLTINSFWGKRWSHILLFGKDWRYKRLLRQAMRRIDRDGIEHLVIDIGLNGGGMTENIYYTLDYLTDRPVPITTTYMITDQTRDKVTTVIGNSPYIAEKDREYLTDYIDSVPSGTRFRTDTVRKMHYIPRKPKHSYDGHVYVLTSHRTYSAAQTFARYCQVLGIGRVAGQHSGGYNAVTGNAVAIKLPASPWMEFRVPYMETIVCTDDEPYTYPEVDIPIDHPFEEWLRRENNSLERLLEIISSESEQ